MKKMFLLTICLFLSTQNLLADEQSILKDHFLNKIESVITIVKNKDIDKITRNEQIVDTLTPMFDFTLMAKLSLGKKWKTLNKIEREKFISLYINRMKQSYSSKLDAYSNEEIEITKIKQPKHNRIELITNLISNENRLEVSYKFYKPKNLKIDKDRWLIYDVVILGISILRTDKAQFREFLQTKTIQELLIKLQTK